MRSMAGNGWQPEEDALLLRWQAKLGNKWTKIAQHIPQRTGQQCAQRWRNKNPNILRDAWSAEEDATLTALVAQHGHAWAASARHLPGRTGQQCMGRWRRHLDPSIKRNAWTPEEDANLMQLYCTHGSSWASIAKALGAKRTPQQCRNRWVLLNASASHSSQGGVLGINVPAEGDSTNASGDNASILANDAITTIAANTTNTTGAPRGSKASAGALTALLDTEAVPTCSAASALNNAFTLQPQAACTDIDEGVAQSKEAIHAHAPCKEDVTAHASSRRAATARARPGVRLAPSSMRVQLHAPTSPAVRQHSAAGDKASQGMAVRSRTRAYTRRCSGSMSPALQLRQASLSAKRPAAQHRQGLRSSRNMHCLAAAAAAAAGPDTNTTAPSAAAGGGGVGAGVVKVEASCAKGTSQPAPAADVCGHRSDTSSALRMTRQGSRGSNKPQQQVARAAAALSTDTAAAAPGDCSAPWQLSACLDGRLRLQEKEAHLHTPCAPRELPRHALLPVAAAAAAAAADDPANGCSCSSLGPLDESPGRPLADTDATRWADASPCEYIESSSPTSSQSSFAQQGSFTHQADCLQQHEILTAAGGSMLVPQQQQQASTHVLQGQHQAGAAAAAATSTSTLRPFPGLGSSGRLTFEVLHAVDALPDDVKEQGADGVRALTSPPSLLQLTALMSHRGDGPSDDVIDDFFGDCWEQDSPAYLHPGGPSRASMSPHPAIHTTHTAYATAIAVRNVAAAKHPNTGELSNGSPTHTLTWSDAIPLPMAGPSGLQCWERFQGCGMITAPLAVPATNNVPAGQALGTHGLLLTEPCNADAFKVVTAGVIHRWQPGQLQQPRQLGQGQGQGEGEGGHRRRKVRSIAKLLAMVAGPMGASVQDPARQHREESAANDMAGWGALGQSSVVPAATSMPGIFTGVHAHAYTGLDIEQQATAC